MFPVSLLIFRRSTVWYFMARYISLTSSPWTTPIDVVHGLPRHYPKWTTLKFAPYINIIISNNYGTQFKIFDPKLDLCHKILEDKKSGLRFQILASCPVAVHHNCWPQHSEANRQGFSLSLIFCYKLFLIHKILPMWSVPTQKCTKISINFKH